MVAQNKRVLLAATSVVSRRGYRRREFQKKKKENGNKRTQIGVKNIDRLVSREFYSTFLVTRYYDRTRSSLRSYKAG